ncbi:MAG: DUF1223 domain-containing protein [Gammaproteobacteria bacterium]|nr:DUF1223 domain-containing protein [Gammaproteobacteria bacterium]
MHGRPFARLISCLFLFPGLVASAETPDCEVNSPPHRVALLELYTSEGCSSCPPADKWLSELPEKGVDANKLVALSLHVDYWNYIGWRDPYSSSQYTARQREQGQRNHLRSIYTPQMVLNGQDYRAWRRQDIRRKLKDTNALPAEANLKLAWSEQQAGSDQSLSINLQAQLSPPHVASQPVVNLVVFENSLVSNVNAGENDGRRLEHDYVVRRLFKYPFAEGRDSFERQLSLPMNKDWNRESLGLALFVQDNGSGEILQAMAHAIDCK